MSLGRQRNITRVELQHEPVKTSLKGYRICLECEKGLLTSTSAWPAGRIENNSVGKVGRIIVAEYTYTGSVAS